MTKFTFNTIGLFTSDNKKMVDFYRDIMGFTTDWNGEEPNVMMRHKDMWLIMFSPHTMPWGQRTCYIADSEGNLIEIHSFTPD